MQKASAAMTPTKITVQFNIHVSSDRLSRLVSLMVAFGNVIRGASDREVIVEIFRTSKMPRLKVLLAHWEASGFLRYAKENSN